MDESGPVSESILRVSKRGVGGVEARDVVEIWKEELGEPASVATKLKQAAGSEEWLERSDLVRIHHVKIEVVRVLPALRVLDLGVVVAIPAHPCLPLVWTSCRMLIVRPLHIGHRKALPLVESDGWSVVPVDLEQDTGVSALLRVGEALGKQARRKSTIPLLGVDRHGCDEGVTAVCLEVGGHQPHQCAHDPPLEPHRSAGNLPSIRVDLDPLAEAGDEVVIATAQVRRDRRGRGYVDPHLERTGHVSRTAAPKPKRPNSLPL